MSTLLTLIDVISMHARIVKNRVFAKMLKNRQKCRFWGFRPGDRYSGGTRKTRKNAPYGVDDFLAKIAKKRPFLRGAEKPQKSRFLALFSSFFEFLEFALSLLLCNVHNENFMIITTTLKRLLCKPQGVNQSKKDLGAPPLPGVGWALRSEVPV